MFTPDYVPITTHEQAGIVSLLQTVIVLSLRRNRCDTSHCRRSSHPKSIANPRCGVFPPRSTLRVATTFSSRDIPTSAMYWIAWIVYARYCHPLAKYPGPFLASISRLWIVSQVAGAKVDETPRNLHAKHGSS